MTEPRSRLQQAPALLRDGKFAEARALAEAILRETPDEIDATHLLGVVALHERAYDEAERVLSEVVTRRPDFALALYNHGTALMRLHRFDEALERFDRALVQRPTLAEAFVNRGLTLYAFERLDGALASYDRALAINPDLYDAHYGRGNVLHDLRRWQEADAAFAAALRCRPNSADAMNNRAIVLADLRRLDEAISLFDRTLSIDPSHRRTRVNRGVALLTVGRYAEGFSDFAHRYEDPTYPYKKERKPGRRWQGEDISDAHLLLWGDQGLGDEILCAGMIDEAASRARVCTVECEPRLARLFQRSFPGITVMPNTTPGGVHLVPYDVQSSMIDIGQWIRPTAASFAPRPSYLIPDEQKVLSIRDQLVGICRGDSLRVGISWQSVSGSTGERKTIPLREWSSLLRIPNVAFFNLQYGFDQSEVDALPERDRLLTHPSIEPLGDLDDFAAVLSGLDLVITISNTTAHLAAAVGTPTWVMVPGDAGKLWYWGHTADTTPWYQSLRIVRYPGRGEAAEAIARVTKDLERLQTSARR